jgi:8-amino-7-oxononanoate synthase
MPPLPWLEAELSALEQADRLRACPPLAGASRAHVELGGRPLVSFCSNDYLGLASHPTLAVAASEAAEAHGAGAGASRLVSGELPPHRDLEAALATFTGLPAALLFSTGYQANLAVLSALAGPDDLILSDQANHASLIDGCRLSRARVAIYRHCDAAAAAVALENSSSFRRRLIVTESIFSMDGDAAPLDGLARLAADNDASLIVDEAHALGALGPDGRGLCRAAGIVPDVLIGTLGKSFGSFGGFAAGSTVLRAYLVNRARTFIYTTSPPAAVAAASLAATALLEGAEGQERRARLTANMQRLHEALQLAARKTGHDLPGRGPIYPVILGSDASALAVSRRLLERGFFVPAIRPPTVPEGTARLRITVSAEHTSAEIDGLGQALLEALS